MARRKPLTRDPPCQAVLTGDIIRSRGLDPAGFEAMRATLMAACAEIAGWTGPGAGSIDFFRGDAWQMLISDPRLALRASLFVRARLRAVHRRDSRIAVGIGHIDRLERPRLSLSLGEAFVLSGQALDAMTRYSDLTIALPPEAGERAILLEVIACLCSAIAGGWTQRQAELVCLALLPDALTNEAIGRRLVPAIRKQTVTRALAGARWHALRQAIVAFEALAWDVPQAV